MHWLWVVLGLALAAAPLVYIVPRPAQRRQALLRERCRQLGLEVKLHALPQIRRLRVRREPVQQGVRLLRRAKRAPAAAHNYWLLIRGEHEDEVPPLAAVFVDSLNTMPAMAVALEHAADGVAAYCDERGEVADVDAIARVLDDLIEKCRRTRAE